MIEVAALSRILKGTGDAVTATFYNDGVAVDPGVVTVDVAYSDGTYAVTGASAAGTGTNARAVTLTPTQTADLDVLTLTWHATIASVAMDFVTLAEIVGAHLFTVAEARTFDKQQLASTSKYPTAAIVAARARIADAFERICGVAFAPRYRLATLDGGTQHAAWGVSDPLLTYPGASGLPLPNTRVTAVRGVETRTLGQAGWVAFDADDLADVYLLPDSYIYRETGGAWPLGRQNVRVGYEHGFPAPPEDIRRAALILLVDELVAKDITNRALSQTTEVGTFRIATAGERGSYFGLPLVDSVLDLYARERVPVFR